MEKEKKPYVLAMYDVRGKQDFIFRTGRIKEIVGGSKIIEDIFEDYLYPNAKIFHDPDTPFIPGNTSDKNGFKDHLNQGYVGEVVYEGGGNYFLLFKDEDAFRVATYALTKAVKENIGTLRILGCCVPVEDDLKYFEADRKRLYAEHARLEASESNIELWPSLPIVQVDRRTSQPLVARWNDQWGEQKDVGGKVSQEIKAKYDKFAKNQRENEDDYGEQVLDNIVKKHGEDSLLAVIYIDGNNMGAQVADLFKAGDVKDYESCVRKLRQFSKGIQEKYVDNRLKDINDYLNQKYSQNKKRRFVVFAGDEINFICNAHDAYDLVKVYLEKLPPGCSVCAGISIFHSHTPYADAYRIAEECCESGKSFMKKYNLKDTSFLDFHYCQGAIGLDLESIREKEVGDFISRPWLMKGGEEITVLEKQTVIKKERVEAMRAWLDMLGRSNVKGLLEAAKSSQAQLERARKRILAHMPEEKREKAKKLYEKAIEGLEKREIRQLIFDLVTVYDLGFGKEA